MAIIKGTLFSDVYKSFLSKITDDMYMQLDPEDTYAILFQLLLSAIPKFEFPRQSLKYQLIRVEEKDQENLVSLKWSFINKLTDEEINILSNYMIVEWIGQQLASVENVRMKYSGADFKFTSQANHMQKLLQLKKDYEREGFHLQRLYKRRKTDEYGIYRSTFGMLMQTPQYKNTNSINTDSFMERQTTIKNISMIKGDTLTFDVMFSDMEETTSVVSIYFSVKKDSSSQRYTFQKSLNNGITQIENLKYRVRIAPEDTKDLASGQYKYDLEVGLGNDIYTVMKGAFYLKQDITKRG